MATHKRILISVFTLLVSFVTAAESRAQFTGLQRMLFRNTEYAGNRNFISTPQGGPLFDNNIYDQRLEFNRLGQGFAFDQFRFFGPDSFDNPNTFDLGPLKVQIGRDPIVTTNPQPTGIHNRIGFTTTLIPELTFTSKTGERAFDIFSGQTNFTSAPLHYNIAFDAGVQKFQWDGNMLVDSSGKINAMGFYDLNVRLINVGNATADGVALKAENVTDFDTGRVHLSGNLLFDGLASLFQGDGAPLAASPFRILSDATPKDKKTDDLMTRLKSGEKLGNDDMQYLVSQMIMTAFQNDPLGFLTNGLPSVVPGFEGLALNTSNTAGTALDPSLVAASAQAGQPANQTAGALSGSPVFGSTPIPEPGTLLLLGTVVVTVSLIRKKSFHPRAWLAAM